jgi:hypothetical protein
VDDDEMAERVLDSYDLKPWDAGLAPVPLRVRVWRAITRAYRRGKAVDWRSYNAAEAEARAAEQAYVAALPGRVREAAAEVNWLFEDVLPEGMRFEVADEE